MKQKHIDEMTSALQSSNNAMKNVDFIKIMLIIDEYETLSAKIKKIEISEELMNLHDGRLHKARE